MMAAPDWLSATQARLTVAAAIVIAIRVVLPHDPALAHRGVPASLVVDA
jgi:hypothetical protein